MIIEEYGTTYTDQSKNISMKDIYKTLNEEVNFHKQSHDWNYGRYFKIEELQKPDASEEKND